MKGRIRGDGHLTSLGNKLFTTGSPQCDGCEAREEESVGVASGDGGAQQSDRSVLDVVWRRMR